MYHSAASEAYAILVAGPMTPAHILSPVETERYGEIVVRASHSDRMK